MKLGDLNLAYFYRKYSEVSVELQNKGFGKEKKIIIC